MSKSRKYKTIFILLADITLAVLPPSIGLERIYICKMHQILLIFLKIYC